jgi:hypothetical protein
MWCMFRQVDDTQLEPGAIRNANHCTWGGGAAVVGIYPPTLEIGMLLVFAWNACGSLPILIIENL